jgi:hypothetical protein
MPKMRLETRANIYAAAIIIGVALLSGLMALTTHRAFGKNWDRDGEQTEQSIKEGRYLSKAGTLPTYEGGQPTGVTYKGNCCGEADAYEANDTFIDDKGTLWAVLTCDDPRHCQEIPEKCVLDKESDQQVCTKNGGKVMRKAGERYRVPPDKVLLGYDPTNDTGFGWVYVSPSSTDGEGKPIVYCWAAPPGY